jgi:plasmid stabilization system protein ParE
MGLEVRLTRRAEEDLNEIFAYIAQDNPEAAERFAFHTKRSFKKSLTQIRLADKKVGPVFRWMLGTAGQRRNDFLVDPELIRRPERIEIEQVSVILNPGWLSFTLPRRYCLGACPA